MDTNDSIATGSESPGLSARKGSAWVTARAKDRAATNDVVSSDPKYKKYSQQVEKCLTTFETMHEWPDFIAFLKQLLKTLQSYTQFKEIPRKLIVAKRLSQCLNPALPSGVHQRALDVYSHILSVLKSEGLKRDLQLWSSGLFPFFEYAATSVKPTLLNLFETYYLPLQASLRPIMKSFILALLPGLEEETGEFFEKVMSLLDQLSGTVSPAFFLQNIWLVMLTTQVPRGHALNFLARRLPRLNADEDVTSIVGRDIGLMIRAFSAALEDDNLLVRRGALDLLVQSMRIDSTAVKQASAEDRTILMRAATSVVLRRDLSLNRRLYTWLLGPDESSDKQMEYLRTHALELLRSTLRHEMFNPSVEYADSRPFKIFISLLDKWEIGSLLTEVLVYDALTAIKTSVQGKSDGGEDTLITANTLYEAVEPHAIWKRLFEAIRQEITTSSTKQEAINMFMFVLKTFRLHEEEVQNIHLPITFSAIVELLTDMVRSDPSKASSHTVRATMELLEEMLRHIPASALAGMLEIADVPKEGGFDKMACAFYGLSKPSLSQAPRSPPITPFVAVFEKLADFSSACVKSLTNIHGETSGQDREGTWTAFSQGLHLVTNLLLSVDDTLSLKSPVVWNPQQWLEDILSCLNLQGCSFLVVDHVITVAGALGRTKTIEPTFSINDRSILLVMMKALLNYLRPNCSPYHVRAVNLIWALEDATGNRHMESIIAQSLTSTEIWNVHEAYETFGVLWRLTDDALLPGFRFKVPMLIVLDSLKSDEPNLRRIGETWMRCNLKAYTRVLDPILYELTDPSIRRMETIVKVNGREIRGFAYERPFDQRRIHHLLDTMLHVVNFGGQGISRVTSSTTIQRSLSPDLVDRVSKANLVRDEASYMDTLVELLLRFLQSEPKPSLVKTMHRLNVATHSTAIDLLQCMVSRGEMDPPMVEAVEAVVISKLYLSVHTSQLDVQNKLLHLLHSVLSASSASLERQRMRTSSSRLPLAVDMHDDQPVVLGTSEPSMTSSLNPLLVHTLVDGIIAVTNRPLLQHWLDFVMMTVSQFPQLMGPTVLPLNGCVCRQLLGALTEVHDIVSKNWDLHRDIVSSVNDAEIIMLLNALERLILFSLPDAADTVVNDEGSGSTERGGPDSTGLLTYVSHVFTSDNASQLSESPLTARSPGYRSLHEGIGVLYSAWVLVSRDPGKASIATDTMSHMFSRTRLRCRKVLERLFRAKAFEVLESIVDYWHRGSQDDPRYQDGAFEIVDFLTASSQNVVHVVCESILSRITNSAEKSRKQAVNPNLTDAILFAFLEGYLERLEGPLAAQVWNRYLTLAKEVASNVREYKLQVFPVLRCMTVLAHKITQTTAIEDRRMRKDLQETYGKLLDACVLIAGRSFDQGNWIRRSNKDSLNVNGRESPVPRVSETKLDEKVATASPTMSDISRLPSGVELIDRINQFLADKVLPNLRRFLTDNDKVAGACSNIVYYVVNSALRGKSSRPLDVDDTVLLIIEEMSRIPAAIKSWRAPVTDVFNDNRFFNIAPEAGRRWRPIIKALIDTDKTAFGELLGKIATAPSANIFTNREYEMLLRSINLRRLSYVLFAAEKNHFLTQLPAIQEKLVDILRNVNASVVESEVYLCIRVLLCRLSPHNLSSFWPVLLTELYRIFEQLINEPPSDGSEDLQAILSACKLVDLLLVLQTEEFQIHQWIFITDTVDAVYPPETFLPEALLDQLAEIVSDLPVTEMKTGSSAGAGQSTPYNVTTFDPSSTSRSMRRPLLKSIKQIDSIRDLAPFFSHISIMSYESVYASGGIIDWETIEQCLMDDLFEGR